METERNSITHHEYSLYVCVCRFSFGEWIKINIFAASKMWHCWRIHENMMITSQSDWIKYPLTPFQFVCLNACSLCSFQIENFKCFSLFSNLTVVAVTMSAFFLQAVTIFGDFKSLERKISQRISVYHLNYLVHDVLFVFLFIWFIL